MRMAYTGCTAITAILKGVVCGGWFWVLLAGCAAPSTSVGPARPPESASPSGPMPAADSSRTSQRGHASYYSDRLAGRATASGEPYAPRELTAAHRSLPFGAVVDVIRDDGRRVQVRINDRGPFTKNRIIDVSRRAAEMLGMIREGTAEVLLQVVSLPPPSKKKKRRR